MNVAKSPVNAEKKKTQWLPPLTEIAPRFREAQGGLTGAEIAQLSGVSDTTIAKCGRGEQNPSWELVSYYFFNRGISVDDLVMGGRKENTPESFESKLIKILNLPLDQRLRVLTALLEDVRGQFYGIEEELSGCVSDLHVYQALDKN
jgi:DNA-binding XRE family transcriptional regulator